MPDITEDEIGAITGSGEGDLIDREVLNKTAHAIRELLSEQAGKKVQFVMLIMDAGPKGRLQWLSTIEREGAIDVLREFLQHQAREYGRSKN